LGRIISRTMKCLCLERRWQGVIITRSPVLATSNSSCAMNLRVYRTRFLILGTILYRSTATFTVFCILSETTVPTSAPRGNFRGGECIKSQPGIVLVSAKSSFVMLGRSSKFWVEEISMEEKDRERANDTGGRMAPAAASAWSVVAPKARLLDCKRRPPRELSNRSVAI
jgi:hypothetical protein